MPRGECVFWQRELPYLTAPKNNTNKKTDHLTYITKPAPHGTGMVRFTWKLHKNYKIPVDFNVPRSNKARRCNADDNPPVDCVFSHEFYCMHWTVANKKKKMWKYYTNVRYEIYGVLINNCKNFCETNFVCQPNCNFLLAHLQSTNHVLVYCFRV